VISSLTENNALHFQIIQFIEFSKWQLKICKIEVFTGVMQNAIFWDATATGRNIPKSTAEKFTSLLELMPFFYIFISFIYPPLLVSISQQ
jgi:hypothetical protein